MCDFDELLGYLVKSSERSIKFAMGYEPKCKVCNSGYQKEVEYMYECNSSYREIKDFLEGNGEFLSLMSISRHFRNHYPKRKAYFDNVKSMEDVSIQEAIGKYQFLKDIFQDTVKKPDYDKMVFNDDKGYYDEIIYTNRPVTDIFLHDHGYCLTEYRFCGSVPKKQVVYMEEILSIIDDKMKSMDKHSFNQSEKIDLLNKKIRCFECRNLTYNNRMDYMMHLLLKNIFNIKVKSEKLNEFLNLTLDELLLSDEVDYDFNKMDKILSKINNTKN